MMPLRLSTRMPCLPTQQGAFHPTSEVTWRSVWAVAMGHVIGELAAHRYHDAVATVHTHAMPPDPASCLPPNLRVAHRVCSCAVQVARWEGDVWAVDVMQGDSLQLKQRRWIEQGCMFHVRSRPPPALLVAPCAS